MVQIMFPANTDLSARELDSISFIAYLRSEAIIDEANTAAGCPINEKEW